MVAAAVFSPLSTYHHGVVRKGKSSLTQPQGIIEDGWNELEAIFRLKMAEVLFSRHSPTGWCGGHKTKTISMEQEQGWSYLGDTLQEGSRGQAVKMGSS